MIMRHRKARLLSIGQWAKFELFLIADTHASSISRSCMVGPNYYRVCMCIRREGHSTKEEASKPLKSENLNCQYAWHADGRKTCHEHLSGKINRTNSKCKIS